MSRLKYDWLLSLLLPFMLLFLLTQTYQVESNTIEDKLWTYEKDVPHQKPIVVAAVSAKGNINEVTHSDIFGNYQLTGLVAGRYYLRCHGVNEFIYHRTNGQNTVFDLGPNDHLKNVDFFLAPFKKGRWENYNYLEHGLAHQDVQVIYQAKNGVMWFKTRGGISLFDGSKFTTIEITGGSYHATGGIYEDEHGVIWFGTSKGGVFQYVNNQIVNFLPDSEINQVEVFDIKKRT